MNNRLTYLTEKLQIGLPSQLLANRPDIRQAEQELETKKLNVKRLLKHVFIHL